MREIKVDFKRSDFKNFNDVGDGRSTSVANLDILI